MKMPYPPPPVRPVLQRSAENDGVSLSKEATGKKLLCDTLSFSVVLQERLARLLPDGPCALAGEWHSKPPKDSANFVLWKVAALLKHDEETRFIGLDDYRPLVNRISKHLNIDDDDGWELFAKSFEKVREGTGAANQRLRVAKLNAQEDIERGTDREYVGRRPVSRDLRRRLLVGIFHYLLRGGKPGERYLASRDAGVLIGVDASRAAKWIRAMVADGYIEKLADSTEFSAARYRWIDV